MSQTNKTGHDVNETPATQSKSGDSAAMPAVALQTTGTDEEPTLASKAATVAVIGLGVALIEAELIPGMLIGAAAVLAPSLLPKFGRGLRPLIKGAIRAGYALTERARETVAEASEQLQDIAAEVKSEQQVHTPPTTPASAHS